MATSLLFALLTLLGCKDRSGVTDGMLTTRQWSDSTWGGSLELGIDVGDDDSSFLITAEPTSNVYTGIDSITDPDGNRVLYWEDWYSGNEFLCEGIWAYQQDMFFNWPIREEDGQLEPGTWTAVLSTTDQRGKYVDTDLEMATQVRTDTRLQDGTLHVILVFARGVDAEAGVQEAVDGAMDRWRQILNPYGLSLAVEYATSDLDPKLSSPGYDSPEYVAIAEQTDGQQVVLVLGETLDGSRSVYGMAGGIPGGLLPTDRSVVALSWLVHAGGDAQFSDEEVRIFGETMAHETGHYMGLAHPVESSFKSYDAISDTPKCSSQSDCESEFSENLMFPYPVCTFSACAPQGQLTNGQTTVTQNYTGML